MLILATLFAGHAAAADWVRLKSAPGPDRNFYDASRLVVEADAITYWRKVEFARPPAFGAATVARGLLRERIDCRSHTLSLLNYLYYAPDGRLAVSHGEEGPRAEPVIPDTLGDHLEQVLCRKARALKNTREDVKNAREEGARAKTPAATVPKKPAAAVSNWRLPASLTGPAPADPAGSEPAPPGTNPVAPPDKQRR